MDNTQDDSLRSSETGAEGKPLLPPLDYFDLPEDEIEKLRKILEKETGHPWTANEVKWRGIELLELGYLLTDPVGWEHYRKHPPLPPGVHPLEPSAPDLPPTPRAYPINLAADHPKEIEKALRMLADELRYVKRRPNHWRWALVSLYDALGHTLAMHRRADFLPYAGLGQLIRLFDAVADQKLEIREAENAVQEVVQLRETWITRGVTAWPVGLGKLPEGFLECLRVIQKLEPEVEHLIALAHSALAATAKN